MAQACSICNHPRRADIEAAILARQSNRRIAPQFGIDESSIRRHIKNCLAGKVKPTRDAQDEQALQTVADKIRWQWKESRDLYDAAKAEGDRKEARCMMTELRQQVTLEAKLSGELDERGDYLSEWAQLRTALLAILQPYGIAEQVFEELGQRYASRN